MMLGYALTCKMRLPAVTATVEEARHQARRAWAIAYHCDRHSHRASRLSDPPATSIHIWLGGIPLVL
jgi:hypothetical protein